MPEVPPLVDDQAGQAPCFDGDGHLLEPLTLWRDHVPARLHDRIRVELGSDGRGERWHVGDFTLPIGFPDQAARGYGMGDALRPGGLKAGRVTGRPYEEAEPGGWDPVRRLAFHDAERILGAVLFPTFGLNLAAVTEPELATAACRAVNDWAAAYASAAPGELFVVATLPQHFPDRAATELQRCVRELGFVAGALRPNPTVDGRRLDHPDFDVVWRAAAELGIPVCIHDLGWWQRPQAGEDRAANSVVQHAIVHPFEAMLAFATLFQGGVLTRYRDLKVGFMEASCGWAPFWVERLQEHIELLGWTLDPRPTRDPVEVFVEQCVLGADGGESLVPVVQDRFGSGTVLWASDFPHFDTDVPLTGDLFGRDDLGDAERRSFAWSAAVAFYGLDWDRIVAANTARRAAAGAASPA